MNKTQVEESLSGFEQSIRNPKFVDAPLEDGTCLPNPPFSSNIIFELTKDDQSGLFYGKVLYNGRVVKTRQVCKSFEEDGSCLYSDFRETLRKSLTFSKRTFQEVCGQDLPMANDLLEASKGVFVINDPLYDYKASSWFSLLGLFEILACVVFVV